MKNSIVIFNLLTLLACSRDSEVTQDGKILPRTLPTVCNGMLCFNDKEEIQDYYEYLDYLISGDDSDTTSGCGDIDSVLSVVESNYNYVSLRSTFLYDDLNGLEFKAALGNDWVSDVVRASILNSNYEFNVGDTVYVKYSANQYYKIPADSTHIIDAFRIANKGEFTDTVPYDLISRCVGLESPLIKIDYSSADTTIPSPPINYRSPDLQITVEQDRCRPRNVTITLRLQNPTLFPTYELANFWISDFGDGSLPTTLGYTDRYIKKHLYSSIGEFTITAHAIHAYIDDNNVEHEDMYEETYKLSTVTIGCQFVESHIELSEPLEEDEETLKMIYKNWNVTDIFGSHVGARTTSYIKNNNGNWKKHQVDKISAKIDGHWRKHDSSGECEIQESYLSETECKTNARDARVSEHVCRQCDYNLTGIVGPLSSECPVYQENDLFSYHYVQISSGSLSKTIGIETCQ